MDQLFAVNHSYLIPLLPLLAAVIAGFFGAKILKGQSHWPIWIGVGISALLALSLLIHMPSRKHEAVSEGEHAAATEHADAHKTESAAGATELTATVKWFDWILAGGPAYQGPLDSKGHPEAFKRYTAETLPTADGTKYPLQPFLIQAGAWFDSLTVTMLCVVCGIGFLITIFAAGYMKGETGYFRFFAYLGLFIFAMTCLVMGNNFVMMYLGWEGVGLCSYLLIGYYYDKPAAREAAKKAFLVNRVGDFGFGLGIMLIYLAFGTVSYFGNGAGTMSGAVELASVPTALMSPFQQHAMQWIPFLLMLGAFGKSAQFPLYVWLPDAMEGPTPVSALIHAATMVTAGIYMIARCGTMFVGNQAAMVTIAAVGMFTAIFAATIALRQFDLKKVFAYSTVSQLGFMFVAVGVLAPVAGVFHLITHAFFKALLFLSSGVVMHAMSGELDMRKFSGLKKVLPKTRWLMLIGCLSLAGAPFLGSGFFSKDEILASAWQHSKVLGGTLLFTAFLTAYYTFRLYFRVFEGPEILPTAPAAAHGHGTTDPHAHGAASDSALKTNTADASGVDTHTTKNVPPADAHGTHGKDSHGHEDHGHHNHEPWIMIFPLVILAFGAFFAGYLNWPERESGLGHFLNSSPSISLAHSVAINAYNGREGKTEVSPVPFGAEEINDPVVRSHENWFHVRMMVISALVAALGIFLAYLLHLKNRAAGDRNAARFPLLTRVLEAKYWVDEIYQAVIVEPLRALGRIFFIIDRWFVDGLVWFAGFVPQASGFALKLTTQRGYLQGYAVSMLFGLAVILLVIFW